MNLSGKGKGSLTGSRRLLHNPDINPESSLVATVEYSADGRSALTVVNGVSGEVTVTVPGPEGVQLVETAWIGDDLLATGLTDVDTEFTGTPTAGGGRSSSLSR